MARIKIFDPISKTWIYADHAFGKDGADGKSAYEYAKDAGYTGTEAEFAQKLIEDNAVKFVSQNLTDLQKNQARENIGAVSLSEVESMIQEITIEEIDEICGASIYAVEEALF